MALLRYSTPGARAAKDTTRLLYLLTALRPLAALRHLLIIGNQGVDAQPEHAVVGLC